jgi:cytochrome c biogenesis protein CcmG, thiol:disulfide interchange protein DsbE
VPLPRRRTPGLTGAACALVVLAAVVSAFAQGPLSVAPGPTVGTPLAAFELTTLEGQPVRLESFRGRPVIIHFFAIRCEPCPEEIPLIQQLGQAAYRLGYDMLGIAIHASLTAVTEYAKERRLFFPIAVDLDSRVQRAYYLRRLPATFFVDRGGVLRDRVVGALTRERVQVALERVGLRAFSTSLDR